MKLYLNLDLLYIIETYIFPLFYYEYKYDDKSDYFIYSPITHKSICIYYSFNKREYRTDLHKHWVPFYNEDYLHYKPCIKIKLEKKFIDFVKDKLLNK